jgi:hypothetical protein
VNGSCAGPRTIEKMDVLLVDLDQEAIFGRYDLPDVMRFGPAGGVLAGRASKARSPSTGAVTHAKRTWDKDLRRKARVESVMGYRAMAPTVMGSTG